MDIIDIAIYYVLAISALAAIGVTVERSVQKSNHKASTKCQATYNRGQ